MSIVKGSETCLMNMFRRDLKRISMPSPKKKTSKELQGPRISKIQDKENYKVTLTSTKASVVRLKDLLRRKEDKIDRRGILLINQSTLNSVLQTISNFNTEKKTEQISNLNPVRAKKRFTVLARELQNLPFRIQNKINKLSQGSNQVY